MKKFKKICLCLSILMSFVAVIWIGKIVIIHEMKKDALPVLGYHSVVDDEDKARYYKNDTYVMSASAFDKQMKYLYDHGYQTLTMKQIELYYHDQYAIDKKSVALTFDDGYKNFHDVVKPILQKYDFHATCFVIGEKAEKPSKNYLDVTDIKNDKTVAYYSHSYGLHHKAQGLDVKAIDQASMKEITEDFEKGKDLIDHTYFAYPYGRANNQSREVLIKQKVHLAFGYNQNRNMDKNDDQYLLPRYLMFSQMPMLYFKWIVD